MKQHKKLTDREHDILQLLTRQYIQTAIPVASADIAGGLHDMLSSASIRNVFAQLTEKGYLEQPHTSAGRIPTQKAYRLFVDGLCEEYAEAFEQSFKLQFEEMVRLQRRVAQALHAVTGIIGHQSVLPLSGFEYLFGEPEFSEQDKVIQFGRFIDQIPQHQKYYMRKLNGRQFHIVIGKENPDMYSEDISVVISPLNNKHVFFVAGAMRMDYEKIINLFISSG